MAHLRGLLLLSLVIAAWQANAFVHNPRAMLVPSQVLRNMAPESKTEAGEPGSSRQRARRKPKKKKKKKAPDSQLQEKLRRVKGQVSNETWRAVPMEEVRLHPHFVPLEEPWRVFVQSAADFGRFRQDSWQWGALHYGRLTTSKIARCLGFYEKDGAVEILRVPRTLQRGGKVIEAWEELRRSPVSLDDLNDEFDGDRLQSLQEHLETQQMMRERVWGPGNSRFPSTYLGTPARAPVDDGERKLADLDGSRLRWGSAQEATSLLTVLNAFWTRFQVEEVGLCVLDTCMAEYDPGAQDSSSDEVSSSSAGLWEALQLPLPKLGASPDGIMRLRPSSGEEGNLHRKTELAAQKLAELAEGPVVVELKNHAPFRKRQGSLVFNDQGPSNELASWHVPQLQFEMLCLGPTCRHAVYVSHSATKGARIYLVRRNDAYLELALRCLSRFFLEFVVTGVQPTPGFAEVLYNDLNYGDLLRMTVQESRRTELLLQLPEAAIQRAPGEVEGIFRK